MALSKTDIKAIAKLGIIGADYGVSVWDHCKTGIIRAYQNNDGGEYANAVANGVLFKDRKDVASYFRKAMLNVTVDGKTIHIGGALDAKHQSKAFNFMKANVPLVMNESQADAQTSERKERELKGFAKDRADKRLSSLITAMKKSDPDAAQILNDRMTKAQVTTHLQPLIDCKPTDEEIRSLVEALTLMRIEAAAKSTPAQVELKVAA